MVVSRDELEVLRGIQAKCRARRSCEGCEALVDLHYSKRCAFFDTEYCEADEWNLDAIEKNIDDICHQE